MVDNTSSTHALEGRILKAPYKMLHVLKLATVFFRPVLGRLHYWDVFDQG